MPGARCPDAVRHWLRTAKAVRGESRRSQIRAKCSCPPTKQSSLLLQGVRCQRSQDIWESLSIWGHSASSLPLCELRIVQWAFPSGCLAFGDVRSVEHDGTCSHVSE